MKCIIAGGTGFVGRVLIKRWLEKEIEITVISRSEKKVKRLFGKTVNVVSWADFRRHSHALLHDCQLVINLAGANIGDKRWSTERKRQILDSRVETTKILASACESLADHAPPLFNASAIGVYDRQEELADQLPPAVDESTNIDFATAPSFLTKVGRAWESATNSAKAHGVHVVNLRFGVVLGKKGGALAKIMRPIQFGLGGPIGTGHQPFSWIHIDDLIAAIEFLYDHQEISGPVNLVAPQCLMQKQLASAIAAQLHRPCFISTPGFIFEWIFGEMAKELLLTGVHTKPQRLLDSGFKFQYPHIDAALQAILAKKK